MQTTHVSSSFEKQNVYSPLNPPFLLDSAARFMSLVFPSRIQENKHTNIRNEEKQKPERVCARRQAKVSLAFLQPGMNGALYKGHRNQTTHQSDRKVFQRKQDKRVATAAAAAAAGFGPK